MNDVKADVVRLLGDLVSIDSQNPPGNEAEVVQYCKVFLEEKGFSTRSIPASPGRSNLLATWGGAGREDPSHGRLLFSGHADTVPVGPRDQWSHPPLELTRDGDRLYGRGACDMKGALAAFLALADRVSRGSTKSGGTPRVPFSIVITVDEELGFGGIRALARENPLDGVVGVVVGEPSGNLPVVGHKGLAWFRVEFQGRAAHGSRPDLGVNAILLASDFLQGLIPAHDKFASAASHPRLGMATVNVGTIRGGVKANIVPAQCELSLDFRFPPPRTFEEYGEFVEGYLRENFPGIATASRIHEGRAFSIDPNHFLCRLVMEAAGTDETRVFPAFTEASVYSNELGLPTVLVGPGSIDQAHVADEFVSLRQLTGAVNIYERCLRVFESWGEIDGESA
ncbi:MAG: M20 family metallopeptidase [Promethearchaeota archaeon]